jgi:NAD(P)-dependent dehydrogenase (short-subunit alcohol dehydrogenase family)
VTAVSLEGKAVAITGAGSGIGLALAHEFSAAGCGLALADVDEEALARCCVDLAGRGVRVSSHTVDVADADAMAAFADAAIHRHGSIQIVVNNAGMVTHGLVADQSLAQLRRVMDVNFWGTVNGCKLFIEHLQQQPWSWIVNMSSVLGLIGVGTLSSYCASKFAVLGFSEALREEIAGDVPGITCVLPGAVNTDILRSAASHHEPSCEDVQHFFATRGAPPIDVARTIVSAVRHGRQRVVISPKAYAIDWLKRLSPVAGGRYLTRSFERQTGLGGWRTQEDDDA